MAFSVASDALRKMFEIIHRGHKHEWAPYTLQRSLEVARDRILPLATIHVPSTSDAQNMAKRFATHGDSFFQFITYQDWIEPTNNLAEHAIRCVVIVSVADGGGVPASIFAKHSPFVVVTFA